MNFLEQLAAERYTLLDYFVQTNLKFGKRAKGGFAGEMDIAAFHPEKRELVHIETSMDADSWEQRRKRFKQKFNTAKEHYNKISPFPISNVRCIAILGFALKGQEGALGEGIEVKSIPQFVREIAEVLLERHPLKNAIPETLPLLRSMQFMLHWGRS